MNDCSFKFVGSEQTSAGCVSEAQSDSFTQRLGEILEASRCNYLAKGQCRNRSSKDKEVRNAGGSNSRKSKQQYQVLQSHFVKHKGAIDNDHLQRLAEVTRLPYAKVYKWCWDQTQKLKK